MIENNKIRAQAMKKFNVLVIIAMLYAGAGCSTSTYDLPDVDNSMNQKVAGEFIIFIGGNSRDTQNAEFQLRN